MYDDSVLMIDSAINFDMFRIRVLIGLSRLVHAPIAYETDTAKKHRSILPYFLLFAGSGTAEFNRLPCSNNKIYDDVFFVDRFRYQLTMFHVCILIGLFRFIYTQIAYEIVTQKITTGNWHDAGHDISCELL